MEKLIITAAICGAEVTKEQNPAVPYTVEEMVREAKSAYEAGAAILHIHVREDDGPAASPTRPLMRPMKPPWPTARWEASCWVPAAAGFCCFTASQISRSVCA